MLKLKLTNTVLGSQGETLAFFFEDYLSKKKAPAHFIVEVLTNLDSAIYVPGQVIIEQGQPAEDLIIIKEGKADLYGYFRG